MINMRKIVYFEIKKNQLTLGFYTFHLLQITYGLKPQHLSLQKIDMVKAEMKVEEEKTLNWFININLKKYIQIQKNYFKKIDKVT